MLIEFYVTVKTGHTFATGIGYTIFITTSDYKYFKFILDIVYAVTTASHMFSV